MIRPESGLRELIGVGAKVAEKLANLGLVTVRDLLHYYPRRYEDFSQPREINQLKASEHHIIKARIIEVHNEFSAKRHMRLTRALASDDSGQIGLLWFNQPFLIRLLKPGTIWLFAGRIETDYKSNLTMVAPVIERHEQILPVYSETAGLTSKVIRKLLYQLRPMMIEMEDWLPEKIRSTQRLSPISQALIKIHFPETLEQISLAKRRLAFDELFLLLLKVRIAKQSLNQAKAPLCPSDIEKLKQFISSLPFTLTDSQRLASWEIIKDLGRTVPMNRLLEGDVGSGKTVVGAIAAYNATAAGYQAVWLTPTEILAHQHYQTCEKLLAPAKVKVGLLTSATTKKITPELENYNLIIGTQAVIQDKVQFSRLGLVIVDEQHRFGVNQRNRLLNGGAKSPIPHLLSMTATPIPRSLALTIYGDLDISRLQTVPAGRQPVITRFVDPQHRQQAYDFIRRQIKAGRQAFVVCPLVEESTDQVLGQLQLELAERKAATAEYQKLSNMIFPDLRVGLIHGKLKPAEKQTVMTMFNGGRIDILVATAVIEVGVDIPNATVMMIESADRFGLAQLHQFRGRVGRAAHQSYCFVFTDSTDLATYERLRVFSDTSSGFDLAELDLELRGPGQLAGLKQSGLSNLKLASLADIALIRQAKNAVQAVLKDGLNRYPVLAAEVGDEQQRAHLG